MGKKLLTEEFWLPTFRNALGALPWRQFAPAAARARLEEAATQISELGESAGDESAQNLIRCDLVRPIFEDVEAWGMDPARVHAVVPAEMGWAGLVNANRRIYPTERFIGENRRLGQVCETEFVGAEKGHPEGQPTFEIAARIVKVEVLTADGDVLELVEESAGKFVLPEGVECPNVVQACGHLAFLKTSAGNDLWLEYQEDMPIGTSSRSYGELVPHKLDENSQYLADNKDYEGQTIDIVESQELITYDLVVVPSAGTYVRGEANEAPHALTRRVGAAPLSEQRREPVEITFELLKKHNAALLEQIQSEAAKNVLTGVVGEVADLDEGKRAQLASMMKLINGGTADEAGDDDALFARFQTTLDAQMGPLRERMTMAEEKQRAAEERAETAIAEATQLKADAAAAAKKAEVEAAYNEAVAAVHKNLKAHVEKFVKPEKYETAEDVKAAVKESAEFAADVSKATAESLGGTPAGEGDGTTNEGNGDDAGDDAPADKNNNKPIGDLTEAVFGAGFMDAFTEVETPAN